MGKPNNWAVFWSKKNQKSCSIWTWCWYLLNGVLCLLITILVDRSVNFYNWVIYRHTTLNLLLGTLILCKCTPVKRYHKYSYTLTYNLESEGRLLTKLYVKGHYFYFPIVNFPFICSIMGMSGYNTKSLIVKNIG